MAGEPSALAVTAISAGDASPISSQSAFTVQPLPAAAEERNLQCTSRGLVIPSGVSTSCEIAPTHSLEKGLPFPNSAQSSAAKAYLPATKLKSSAARTGIGVGEMAARATVIVGRWLRMTSSTGKHRARSPASRGYQARALPGGNR